MQLPAASGSTQQQPATVPRQQPSQENPETIRLMFLSDPHQLALLKERNPRLAEVINNADQFRKVGML